MNDEETIDTWKELVESTDVQDVMAVIGKVIPTSCVADRLVKLVGKRGARPHFHSCDLRSFARGLISIADWLDAREVGYIVEDTEDAGQMAEVS